jgi:hypothetical protein
MGWSSRIALPGAVFLHPGPDVLDLVAAFVGVLIVSHLGVGREYQEFCVSGGRRGYVMAVLGL